MVRLIISVNKWAKLMGISPRKALMKRASEITDKEVIVPGWEDDL